MNLNEKRMVYQLESTCQVAVLNEIAMTHRYTRNQTTKDTAKVSYQNSASYRTRNVWTL